jgi:hypothetical protein
MVASEHHNLFETCTTESTVRQGRIGPERIFENQCTLDRTIYRDEGTR